MQILQNYDLTRHSTFRLPSKAAYFALCDTKKEIQEAYEFSKTHKLELLPIGKGSNIILGSDFIDKFVIEINLTGIHTDGDGILTAGAGEIWDNVVAAAVEQSLAGIECLSAIPGTAGATPIQNVGAYGQEIKDIFVKLTAFDLTAGKFIELDRDACEFQYRDSSFKNKVKGKYIITDITLELAKNGPPTLTYQSLVKHLKNKGIENPVLADVRQAVIEIRKIKLPDPSIISSAGSFFKNPIVDKNAVNKLLENYPNAPIFKLATSHVANNSAKLSAGWLIEQCGLKGITKGHFGTYKNNALVLIHNGEGTYKELNEFAQFVKDKVFEKFGIELEQEPETIF